MDKNNFYFGMNIHNKYYAAYPENTVERNILYCKELGINMIRINLVPESEERYSFLDSFIELTRQNNMELMLCVDAKPYGVENPEEHFYKYFRNLAERERGKIKIYQAFNEVDNWAMFNDMGEIYNAGDGKVKDEYNPSRLSQTVPAVRGAIRGIREGDPDAMICVNFCWWHTYYIENLSDNGCEWDITGCDWYSDAENKSSFTELVSWLNKKYNNKPIMLCETNWWAYLGENMSENERNENQKNWLREFTKHVYKNLPDNVQGMIYYELMDEPAFEKNENYSAESHFGLIKCMRDGSFPEPKPIYKELQSTIKELVRQC